MKPRFRKSSRLVEKLDIVEKEQKDKLVDKQRRYRNRVFKNKKWHEEVKSRDRNRKVESRAVEKMIRQKSVKAISDNREYERLRKRKQREKKKSTNEDFSPAEWKDILRKKQSVATINATRRMQKRTPENRSPKIPSTSSTPKAIPSLIVSTALFKNLTPQSRKRTKMRLKDTLSPGKKKAFRDVLGINLSNPIAIGKEDRSGLKKKAKDFFDRDDVSRLCPDTRKIVRDPENPETQAQVRYRMSYLKLLHQKFIAETSEECSYETFTRHVPFYVRKPAAEEWGTCLCRTCLNPELKVERLQKLKKIPSVNLEDSMEDFKFGKLIETISNIESDSAKIRKKKDLDDTLEKQMIDDTLEKQIVTEENKDMAQENDAEETITFTEWRKVEYETKKGKKSSVSRKMHLTFPIKEFTKNLIAELKELKEHLHRAHMQYRAFKEKRIEAQSEDGVITIQIDWSENAKIRQAQEERSAYYHQDQLSIHAMRVWSNQGEFSHAALSDELDHTAPAVFASIEPVINQYIENGATYTHVNIVSDSPSNQYRNKNAFWLLSKLCVKTKISFDWIYLEGGHGKGTPDGIGAVVKRAIADSVALNPDLAWNSLDDFLKVLPGLLPSVQLTVFTKSDISNKHVPPLKSVNGSNKCHEISMRLKNGAAVKTMKELSNGMAKPFNFVEDKRLQAKEKQIESSSTVDKSSNDVKKKRSTKRRKKEESDDSLEEISTEEIENSMDDNTDFENEDTVDGDPGCSKMKDPIHFDIKAKKLKMMEWEWLEIGKWYCMVSPKYEYWFVGRVNEIIKDDVKMSFIEQISEDTNQFRDEDQVELVPVAEVFYKLKSAPKSVSSSRSTVLKLSDFDFTYISKNYENFI